MSPEMGQKAAEVCFPLEILGTYSCHGVEPGSRNGQTNAKINQDRGCVVYPFGPENDYALFCVYDGHGANGDKVSQFVATKMPDEVLLHMALGEGPALTKAFDNVDAKLKADRTIDAELSGTTAVVLLMKFDKDNPTKAKLWSACAGDSRAVLQQKASGTKNGYKNHDLTEDQKPNTPAEQARIIKCGGYVSPPEEEWGGPARVWLDANMTLPGLAMARSIGDHLVGSVGVVPTPVVCAFDIDVSKADELIVLASDGVWEFIESLDALDILDKAKPKTGAKLTKAGRDATAQVTKLIETAAAKWRQEEGDYRDDITAIAIDLEALLDHRAKNPL